MTKKSTQNVTQKDTKSDNLSDKRSRNWATIIYPESAPQNFRELISEARLDAFLSPLHTDMDEETQLEKKPHHHLEMKFGSKKSKQQILEIVKAFGGVGAEPVNDFRSYARYLCHLDQPHKKQYDKNEVQTFGSLDYISTIESTADKYVIIGQIMQYCDDHTDEIKYMFSRLLRISRDEHPEWFRHLCDDCGYIIKEYLTSSQYEAKMKQLDEDKKKHLKDRHEYAVRKGIVPDFDPLTGEIK